MFLLLINFVVSVGAGVSMYFIVEKHNKTAYQTNFLEPASSAVLTALLAAVVAPYLFYKMRGPVGLIYGIAFVFGMVVSSATVTAVAAAALN